MEPTAGIPAGAAVRRPWSRLTALLRLERSDMLTLTAFALGVGLSLLVTVLTSKVGFMNYYSFIWRK